MESHRDSREGGRPDTGRGGAWLLGQIALLAAIALAPRRLPGLPALPEALVRPSEIGGLLAGAIGGLLALAGARTLGPNLTAFPRPRDDGALVQDGVYGKVRHPIYGGVVLLALGWSLLRKSIPSLALTVVLALFLDRKARREETWLVEKFADYRAYQDRVRRRIL